MRLVGLATVAVLATSFLVSAQQSAPRVWTIQELFTRNVGSTAQQDTPFAPHKIVANVYYVGTESLSSFLVTTPVGHFLINSSYERTVPKIRDSVAKLGFNFEDVKILLGSHAHGDHMQGDKAVVALTGAKAYAMAEDLPALANIGGAATNPRVDYASLKDGDTVSLGGVVLTAHHTPGHTPGCTTWTLRVAEGGRTHDVLIIGSVGVNPGTNLVGNPTLVSQYERSLAFLKSAHVDVPLGSHPAMFSMAEKYRKIAEGGPNPYIDPAGFKSEVTIQETAFINELKRQQVEGPPARRGGGPATPPTPARGAEVLTTDHYVKVVSSVPAISGQVAQLYVRERAMPETLAAGTNLADRVVLFVHGAGTPAEVAFDVAYQDYSWMAALAQGGFDVFAMDVSGYGRSVRPWPMNDPCNLSAAQQALLVPALMPAPCAPSYAHDATTIGSDWNDIDAVVNHLGRLRGVDRVSLVGWSLGGPRTGGYASTHPDKVRKLVLLSPAYSRGAASTAPAGLQGTTAFNTQSRTEFDANWDRQLGCPNQFDTAARESVWSAMIASDPIGATWGALRRAPSVTTWGWNREAAGKLTMPLLLISPAHDAQVAPATVRALYDDAAAPQKVLVDLACSSHNALWERLHGAMFAASVEFLSRGTVNGAREGTVKLGY